MVKDHKDIKLRCLGSRLLRTFFVLMALLMLVAGIRNPAPEWDFRWWHLPLVVLLYAGPAIILPLTLPTPVYFGDISKADFFPVVKSWPVFYFWLGLVGFFAFTGVAVRRILVNHTVDFYGFVALVAGVWVWLLYRGKLEKWKPHELTGPEHN